ncbi:MAG: hypothetical protein ACUVXB_07030 [Bryobacteraceae bacterium]
MRSSKAGIILMLLIASTLSAFRPAVDTSGPLTVKIEGPAEIVQIKNPENLTVVIENSADADVKGTVRVEGIDGWHVEPSGNVPFAVPAKSNVRLPFRVSPASVTYNAFYPVHAYAEFGWQGRPHTAHPILVVPVKLPYPPAPDLSSTLKPLPGPARRVQSSSADYAFPPPGPGRLLGSLGQFQVRLWPGARGLMDGTVGFEDGPRRLYFRGFQGRVLGHPVEGPDSANRLIEARDESQPERFRTRLRFQSTAGPFELVTEAWLEKGALRFRFAVENATQRPWLPVYLEDLAAGPCSERVFRLYAGAGNVMQDPQAFRLRYNGHFLSTSYIGIDFANGFSLVQGVDVPPDHLALDPAARTCSLHTPHDQTVSFVPSADVWSAARSFRDLNAPKAAPGVTRVAGRFTIDLWRGRYADSAAALRRAFRYGLTDSAVIWHRWQRWGYDYRLPDIYPPSPEWDTVEEFFELVATCKKHGVLFAPHDNYIDIYPDSEGFSYDKMAFTADRKPQEAFFNRGLGAQSYHPNSDAVLPLVKRNLKLIKEGFAPDAYFIDVWSSEPPYDYFDSSGRFFTRVHTRDVWRQAFAWIREYLDGAPQISEAGADQYIGWLDAGAGAHMRAEGGPERSNVWRVETSDTERIPWFDAIYHDVFLLQGAGYPGRYNSGQDSRLHGIYSDDYITTEVMTGHPAMVWDAFHRDTVRKYWLLHDLMRGLALRRMESFSFEGSDIHRHRIRWQDGGEVWVNRGKEDWIAGGRQLPQYGFYARVPAKGGLIEAAIERRQGLVVEWAKAATALYVNARQVVPEPVSGRGAAPGGGDQGPDPRLPRMNPEGCVVDFGPVTTNGGLRLLPNGRALELISLPNSPAFQVRLRWRELPWKLAQPKEVEAVDEEKRTLGRMPVQITGGEIQLTCEPNVFAYRLLW